MAMPEGYDPGNCNGEILHSLKKYESNSQSPTIYYATEFDTLQEGDWAILNKEENRRFGEVKSYKPGTFTFYHETLPGEMFKISYGSNKKTQLTPSEFLRRAENTFKK